VVGLSPSASFSADVRVANGLVTQTGTVTPDPNEIVLDLKGKVLMPGMVCAHTHLYSSLVTGMPPPRSAPKSFLEVLKRVWWKIDEALDEEVIRYSALVGAMEAVKHGTTTIIDHHSSPNCIDGSLEYIVQALEEVGVRGVLCYETTDRGGKRKRDKGLAENERFVSAHSDDRMFRGLIEHMRRSLWRTIRCGNWAAWSDDCGPESICMLPSPESTRRNRKPTARRCDPTT